MIQDAVRKLRPAPPPARVPLARVPAAILFDLDGTLVDTMPAFADIAAEVIEARHGMPFRHARQQYLRTSGVPFAQQLEIIFGDHPENRAASDEFEARKVDAASAARLDAPTLAGLMALRARGIRLVVSSNGAQHHVDTFAAHARGVFELAFGFASGPAGAFAKGEPHVAEACARLGVDRPDVLMVGDSLRDGEIAAEASVPFVGRTGTFSRADFAARFPGAPVVDEIADLAMLLPR